MILITVVIATQTVAIMANETNFVLFMSSNKWQNSLDSDNRRKCYVACVEDLFNNYLDKNKHASIRK